MSKLLKPHVCIKSFWLCRTLCDPVDYSLPGPSVHGILQARMLEWLAISFSRGSSWPRDRTRFSYASWVGRWVFTTLPPGRPSESRAVALSPSGVSDSVTPWAVVRQAPLSIGVPRTRMLEWVAMASSGCLPNPGIEPGLPPCRWILHRLSRQGCPRILEGPYSFNTGTRALLKPHIYKEFPRLVFWYFFLFFCQSLVISN